MIEQQPISIGFSPCPNDTYIFNALVHGRVPLERVRFSEPLLEDVETLNLWALRGRLDVTKLSFHALGHVQETYTLLQTGAALGRGCGPLLVTGTRPKVASIADWKIAIPGACTTAALLMRLYQPAWNHPVVLPFDQIMAAVAEGRVDAGVIIHESRFTYQQHGLHCIEDLGEWWERSTGLPIPLGCIAARSTLGPEVHQEIDAAIAASIRWADAHPDEGFAYIRSHAQELEIDVIRSHIGLYVNDFSRELGDEGRAAVQELLRRGAEAGLFSGPPHTP
ncbi:1,4-dihydroxy-6-naphthoate synthase [Desulfobulbus alkaliphilus]|uniref:1,4-dihydroxy-6-naphthoate synthase n=1 Tax=Desulfobulbus alkaliphilus TaxID=869814 RepID=UPI0019652C50|nr:1,4-dihydroxy-6-naphthoate synthase [Desulfobulbus alkaliphilus]MBM9537361.1 1,4-dihydroxy-6-naphthoate synthase [Desulfobulbus alkaliphilus]